MFEWIVSIVQSLGYTGVFLLAILENVFPPIPSELIIPLAGFVAAQGHLTLGGVIASGSAGALLGAVFWYEVGRRIGERRVRAWADRYGKWMTVTPAEVDQARDWFRRHGHKAVLVGRLVPAVRSLISLPAGFACMSRTVFLAYSAAGTLAWTAALAWSGVALQANFTMVAGYIDLFADAVLIVFAALLARRYYRCWRDDRFRA